MILFSLPRTAGLAASVAPLAGLREGRAVVERFANGELHATLETPASGTACWLFGGVAPPDADLLSTLLLAHTLGENGAASLTAVLPYLGYARQDRREPDKSRGAAWLGRLLAASGVQEVVTVDVHSPLIHELFPVPVRSLSPASLVAAEIAAGGVDDLCIVAPDEGAIPRSDAVRTAARVGHPLVWLEKRRTPNGVVHRALHGTPAPRAVVVDDILDTGGTLLSACETLRRAGVQEIVVAVTHGLFTGTAWRRLSTLGVTRIVCTDTTTPPVSAGPVTVLSVAPLLAAYLAAAGGRHDAEPRGGTAMKEQEFVTAVQAAAALDSPKEAVRWTDAVVAALADVAPDAETRRHLLTQLPGSLKSRAQERAPRGLLMDREALIGHVAATLGVHAPEARRALLAVWGVMRQAVSAGELADFEARMPPDVAAILRAA